MIGLIINHDTKYICDVMNLFKGCDVMNHINFNPERAEEYDYIVLSGGPGDPRAGREREKEWIKNTNKPILGICLGFQMICLAYGENMIELPRFRKLNENLTFVGENYNMAYNHSYYFDKVPSDFYGEVKNGLLTYIKHKSKPVLAFQGHPEITKDGSKMKDFFIEKIVNH